MNKNISPVWLSYATLAQLIDVKEKTLRNRVSAGTFPPPTRTEIGPRWPASILDEIADRQPAAQAEAPRPRGRPRIARRSGQGGRS